MKKQIIDASGAIAHFIKANGLAEWQPGSYSSLTDPDAGDYNYPEVGTYYAYATLIPSLAASISTDTKYGRWASMGGLQFTTAAYSRQVAMMEETALTAKTASGAARALGYTGAIFTLGSDAIGMYNYYQYGDMSPYAVSPLQTMTDMGATYIGIYGGPPGIIISTVYFSLSPYMYAPMGISPITIPQTSDATYVAPQYQH